ncbi:MAG: glycine C-acetyltransferase [SAR202 cluster bacterium]|nr:glycine C-acetyltransferase [SAR202 cluster bacterium]
MTYTSIKTWLEDELQGIRDAGMYKAEKLIKTPQGSQVDTPDGPMINFCANNYLGLADSDEIEKAVSQGTKDHGFGMASVRFICGTQDIHKTLEQEISGWMGTEDTILYTSCFDANTGLFETILSAEDAIISDELNHASIIDGIRLCKADRKRYKHSDMADLEEQLKATAGARFRMIATDGVFSMQGDIAPLKEICDLADKYDALVMVDDSHATGFLGPNGLGSADDQGVMDRIDVFTSTMGKALGGASGGYTTGRKEIVEFLRQRSRPYLFSNTLAPPIVMGALKALELVRGNPGLRETLWENTAYFRSEMEALGFDILPGKTPIMPIMLRDELKTVELAKAVNEKGIFVVGFTFPVVPRGQARIRVQISAAHTREQLDRAISVFEEAGKALGAI